MSHADQSQQGSIAPPSDTPKAPLPAAARCAGCGYVLEGLSPASLCPECGVPIAHSLAPPLLRETLPSYHAVVLRGANRIATTLKVMVALPGLVIVGFVGQQIVALVLSCTLIALTLALRSGTRHFTTPAPASLTLSSKALGHARAARWSGDIATYTLIAFCTLAMIHIALVRVGGIRVGVVGTMMAVLVIATTLSAVAWAWSLLSYSQALCDRLPDERLATNASRLRWAVSLSGCLACVVLWVILGVPSRIAWQLPCCTLLITPAFAWLCTILVCMHWTDFAEALRAQTTTGEG
jgi:hypothetical protein